MRKRILALLLTAAFILLMVPSLQVASFAAPDTTYTGTENEKIVYNFLIRCFKESMMPQRQGDLQIYIRNLHTILMPSI